MLPNVPEAHLEALQAEPIFEKFAIHAGGWGGWAAGGARCGWDAVRWGGCVGGRAVFGDWLAEHHAVLRVAKWQPRRAHTHPRPPRSPAPPPLLAGPLQRGLVSCTGAQFCGLALIETKNRALAVVAQLEAELDLPSPVRIHWTGESRGAKGGGARPGWVGWRTMLGGAQPPPNHVGAGCLPARRGAAALPLLAHPPSHPLPSAPFARAGCPNSCGQAQVGDIGLMGAPAKLEGKAVEGVKIMLGGKIGENPEVRVGGRGVGCAWCGGRGRRGAARGPPAPRAVACNAGRRAPPPLPAPSPVNPRPPRHPAPPPLASVHPFQLAKEFEAGVPAHDSVLLPKLRQLLISEFGARPRGAAAAAASPEPAAVA